MNFFRAKKGFTVLELLMVIAIANLVLSMAVASIRTARAKARDVKRIADMRQIQTMLEMYIDKYGTLPAAYNYGEGDQFFVGFWDRWWDHSTSDLDGDGRYFLDFLIEGGVASAVPVVLAFGTRAHPGPPTISSHVSIT